MRTIRLRMASEKELAVKFSSFHWDDVAKMRQIEGKQRGAAERGTWLIPFTIRSVTDFLEQFGSYPIEPDPALLKVCPFLQQWFAEREGTGAS